MQCLLQESLPGTLIWHSLPKDQLVVWAIVCPGGWPEPWGLGQRLGCFAGWGGEGDGCRPRHGRARCQGVSGTPFFLVACSAPSWGPSRVQEYMVSARQVHLPHYLYPLSCQHLPITCSIGTLWKWPTAAWPSWYAWLTFQHMPHLFRCLLFKNGSSKSVLYFTCKTWLTGSCFKMNIIKWRERKIHPLHLRLMSW